MTREELIQRINAIDEIAKNNKRYAYVEYVKTNHLYNVGDIVSDNSIAIRIERIGYSMYGTFPSIYYEGPALTKKGEPRKDGTRCKVYERNARRL